MPLLDRDTLIDRPVLVDREDEEDQEDTEDNVGPVETFGEGGGPVIHGIEFEPQHTDIVAASNGIAVIASGGVEGQHYQAAFINSAVMMKELTDNGHDISEMVEFSKTMQIAFSGLNETQREMLDHSVIEDSTDEEDEDVNTDVSESDDEEDTGDIQSEVDEDEDSEDGSGGAELDDEDVDEELQDLEEDIEEVKSEE